MFVMSTHINQEQILSLPLTCSLPETSDAAAKRIQRSVVRALEAGDQTRLIHLLVQAERELSPPHLLDACWIPCIIGCAERDRCNAPLPAMGALYQFIEEQTRPLVNHLPLDSFAVWLVPAYSDDLTASVLTCLVMNRNGQATRPWRWSQLPHRGRFRLVGTMAPPFALLDNPHALAPTSLLNECRQRILLKSSHSMN